MPRLQTISLRFPQGLHVGVRGVNLEEAGVHIPSDTLFSALVDIWGRAGGDPAAWISPFQNGDPPFLLTSAFPFASNARFYPMPVDLKRIRPEDRDGAPLDKSLKRIRFFSEGLLRKALAGQSLQDDLPALEEQSNANRSDQKGSSQTTAHRAPATGVMLQDGALWLLQEEIDQLPDRLRLNAKGGKRSLHALKRQDIWTDWTEERAARVTVDRVNSAANIFHVGRTRFASECGLWFGVHWRNPNAPVNDRSGLSYRQALCKSLALLGDEGIGGERSAGYGAFHPTYGEEIDLPDPESGGLAWLLSRYLPAQTEIPAFLEHKHAAYHLVRVGGWARSLHGADQRRKQITFLAEGSLIACSPSAVVGSIVDLRPQYPDSAGDLPHPVWRSGLALAVGLANEKRE